VVSSAYSRDEEREADRLGVDWMAAAGFDPEGALRLHERLLQSGGRGIPIPFLQTHPAGEERIARIRQQIAGLAPATIAAAPVIEAAAPVIETGTPQGNWPPPNWLPVVPPADQPAIAAPVEFAAGDRRE
jgi:hypothetical protein